MQQKVDIPVSPVSIWSFSFLNCLKIPTVLQELEIRPVACVFKKKNLLPTLPTMQLESLEAIHQIARSFLWSYKQL